MRTLTGLVAGIASGTCAWAVKDSGAGIFTGSITAITIWFWAWGNLPGERRG